MPADSAARNSNRAIKEKLYVYFEININGTKSTADFKKLLLSRKNMMLRVTSSPVEVYKLMRRLESERESRKTCIK